MAAAGPPEPAAKLEAARAWRLTGAPWRGDMPVPVRPPFHSPPALRPSRRDCGFSGKTCLWDRRGPAEETGSRGSQWQGRRAGGRRLRRPRRTGVRGSEDPLRQKNSSGAVTSCESEAKERAQWGSLNPILGLTIAFLFRNIGLYLSPYVVDSPQLK
ncbi:hypothetical protein R6Z07F_014612 [Ovis aries]